MLALVAEVADVAEVAEVADVAVPKSHVDTLLLTDDPDLYSTFIFFQSMKLELTHKEQFMENNITYHIQQ